MARRFRSRMTAGRHFKSGVMVQFTALSDIITTAYRGDGGQGTYVAPIASSVQKGVSVGQTTGTLVGVIDSSGVNQGTTGILVSGIFYASGTLSSSGVYNATGVIYDSGSYATEASRNTDPGEAYVLTGHNYTILGSSKIASYSPDFPDVGNVLDTDTVNGITGTLDSNKVLKSAGGNYNDDNLTVGNIRPISFGIDQTGTLANLSASDLAYINLESSRNDIGSTVADDIIVGKSVKIRNITTDGTYIIPVQGGYSAIAPNYGPNSSITGMLAASKIRDTTYGTLSNNSVLVAAGGTYIDPVDSDVRKDISFGVPPRVGTLDTSAYYLAGTTAQYLIDQATVNSSIDWIVSGHSILGQAGIFPIDDYCLISSVVGAEWVVIGHSNRVGGDIGTYPTTETSMAAQLAIDQAVVTDHIDDIKLGVIILGVSGTYDPITGHYTDPGKEWVFIGRTYVFDGVLIIGEYTADVILPQTDNVDGGVVYGYIGNEIMGTGMTANDVQAAVQTAVQTAIENSGLYEQISNTIVDTMKTIQVKPYTTVLGPCKRNVVSPSMPID